MTTRFLTPVLRPFMSPTHWLLMGAIAGWLGLAGPPTASLSQGIRLMPTAIAQATVTPEEVTQYARSVLEMDPYRNEAYTRIKDLLLSVNMDISDINMACSDAQDISQVPRAVRRQVREILVNYCNQAQDIVEKNGLSPRRFNEITDSHQADDTLFQRIQQELIRLQQEQRQ